jgi:hypothetical protein
MAVRFKVHAKFGAHNNRTSRPPPLPLPTSSAENGSKRRHTPHTRLPEVPVTEILDRICNSRVILHPRTFIKFGVFEFLKFFEVLAQELLITQQRQAQPIIFWKALFKTHETTQDLLKFEWRALRNQYNCETVSSLGKLQQIR